MKIKNYEQRLSRLQNRKTDNLLNKANLTESFTKKELPETIRYVFEGMESIAAEYTTDTYLEANRVKNQIEKGLDYGVSVSFEEQGSVPLNTHIKVHSDLDIVVVHGNFHTVERPQTVLVPYTGDSLADLKNLRSNIRRTLSSAFPAAKVDDTKAKAISICEGSLTRKFDVIISSWFDTNEYARTGQKKDRALYIYDNKEKDRFLDFPFSHMARVMDKANGAYNDNFRRLIRFLKNLKMDAEPIIGLSSFLITSIYYHMPDSDFSVLKTNSTKLLINASRHLDRVLSDPGYRKALFSPNGTELLFALDDDYKVGELHRLKKELDETIHDVAEELESSRYLITQPLSYGYSLNEILEKANVHYKI
jgi:hypothetical protein